MTKLSNLIQHLLFTASIKKRYSYSSQILCYHSVSNNTWQYSINPSDFEKQLVWLKTKFEIVPLNNFLKSRSGDKPKLALTFDDGYIDVFTNALPIMQKHNVVGTVFLCEDSRKLALDHNSAKFMDNKMIARLVKAGWEVGHHSYSHADLVNLTSDEELEYEIDPVHSANSFNFTKPLYFAYPYGHHDIYSERFIKEYYSYGFTTDPIVQSFVKNTTIGRVMVEKIHSKLDIFKSLVSDQGRKKYHIYNSILRKKVNLISYIKEQLHLYSSMPRVYYPPKLIDSSFVAPYHPEDPSDSYYFGIYKNKSIKFFVKFWSAKKINIRYKWLKNESLFYKMFWELKTSQNIKKNGVTIPKYYGSNFSTNPPYLIIEKIVGNPISKLNLKKQLTMINNSLIFLSDIYKELSKKQRSSLPNRSPIYWVLLSFCVTLGALYRHPKKWRLIFKLVVSVALYSFRALMRRERSIVHRDINEWNILLGSNGKTVLIDFQLICLADPLVEVAIIILKYYSQKANLKKILNISYIKSTLNTPNAKGVLMYYLLLFTLYDYHLNNDSTPEAIRLAEDYLEGNINI